MFKYRDKAKLSAAGVVSISVALLGMAVPAVMAGLPDPTRPGHVRTYSSGLQYTIISGNERLAVINGRTYRVGDRVGASTITRIESHEVIMNRGGKTTRLRMVPRVKR